MKSGKTWSKEKKYFASFSNKNKRCFKNQNKKKKNKRKRQAFKKCVAVGHMKITASRDMEIYC